MDPNEDRVWGLEIILIKVAKRVLLTIDVRNNRNGGWKITNAYKKNKINIIINCEWTACLYIILKATKGCLKQFSVTW